MVYQGEVRRGREDDDNDRREAISRGGDDE